MKKILTFVLGLFMAIVCLNVQALEFFPLFSSNSILQRDKDCPVWGYGEPNSTVDVSLIGVKANGKKYIKKFSATADANGRWQIVIPKLPAGGEYTLTAKSGEKKVVSTNITFGDLWICSGQSNMEMSYGWGLTRGREDIETASYDNVRLLMVPNYVTLVPTKNLTEGWTLCTPETAKRFSACGYFFGTALYKALEEKVPVGLIDVTWSGTAIETWLSYDSIASVSADHSTAVANRLAEIDAWEKGGKLVYEKELADWEKAISNFAIDASSDDSAAGEWKPVNVPLQMELHIKDDFDGLVKYTTTVVLTEEQAASKNAVLCLGALDDFDLSFVNGTKVGSMNVWNRLRKYSIPEGVLKAGENKIDVTVIDFGGGGGFASKPEEVKLVLGAEEISLAKEWKYQAKGLTDVPKQPKNIGAVSPYNYSTCYNGMLHQLFPAAIKGAIWYQGCSNVGRHYQYDDLFAAMAADWRKNFSAGDFPIYMVQLAAFMGTHDEPFNSNWAAMRWTQTQIGESLKNCGTICAIDVGDHGDIHPKDKKTVGERLARMACARTYNMPICEAGPTPLSAVYDTKANKVVVRFKNCAGLKTSDGAAIEGFELSDAEGTIFRKVAAEVEGDCVVIKLKDGEARPAKVRYAWDDYPKCNLINGELQPSGPFELDVGDFVTLENAGLSLIYDSSNARIVSFRLDGSENMLWVDDTIYSKMKKSSSWVNYGGEKTWIWPMETWPKNLGRLWPPPAILDEVESCSVFPSKFTGKLG